MGYEEQFCREAARKHWEISFSGELYQIDNAVINVERWMERQLFPRARLGWIDELKVKSFYFVEGTINRTIRLEDAVKAQEIAQVYPERYEENNYQQQVLDAAILHLQSLPKECEPSLVLPEAWAGFVTTEHGRLLHLNGVYGTEYGKQPLLIFKPGCSGDMHTLLNSCRIVEQD